jgi:energy-converting hydrogenase Eha subunit A
MNTTSIQSAATQVAVRVRPMSRWVIAIVLVLIASTALSVGLRGSAPDRPAPATANVVPAELVADGSRAAMIHVLTGRALSGVTKASRPPAICIPCVARAAEISGRLG